jgi:hypothetical protein
MTVVPSSYSATRDALRRIAAHVLARAQFASIGRIGLRATPGGFGTVQFGAERTRLRISGALLVRETGDPSGIRAVPLAHTTLTQLADFAAVDLSEEFSVGHDTPPLGDVDAAIDIDGAAVAVMGEWYALTARALDATVAAHGDAGAATVAQLWPEHFDLALDLAYDPTAPGEHRVNLGGAPGDAFHAEPYLYVGPWTSDRPGDPEFWNAPFGAFLPYDEVMTAHDPLLEAISFFEHGVHRLGAAAS